MQSTSYYPYAANEQLPPYPGAAMPDAPKDFVSGYPAYPAAPSTAYAPPPSTVVAVPAAAPAPAPSMPWRFWFYLALGAVSIAIGIVLLVLFNNTAYYTTCYNGRCYYRYGYSYAGYALIATGFIEIAVGLFMISRWRKANRTPAVSTVVTSYQVPPVPEASWSLYAPSTVVAQPPRTVVTVV